MHLARMAMLTADDTELERGKSDKSHTQNYVECYLDFKEERSLSGQRNQEEANANL